MPARRRFIASLAAAAIVATSIVALPAASASAATYRACVKKKSGELRVVKAKATCPKGWKKISWNSVGPTGPTGPTGATGSQGAAGNPGPGNAYVATRSGAELPLGTTPTAVVTTPILPAGSYVLSARVNVLATGSPVTTICSMEMDAAQNFSTPVGTIFPVAMSSWVTLDTARSLTLTCWENGAQPGSIAAYQAWIIATQVGSITVTEV